MMHLLPALLFALSSLVINQEENTQRPSKLAEAPSEKTTALQVWQTVGYTIPDSTIRRRGNEITGSGFWDALISHDSKQLRIVYFGHGEYLKPHLHDQEELFIITAGGCDLWLFDAPSGSWNHSVKQTGDQITIPPNTIHCLVASNPKGLSMHVPWDDRTRSIVFVATPLPDSFK